MKSTWKNPPSEYEVYADGRSFDLLPTFHFVDKIPEWITSSDVAAYHPFARTVWVRTKGLRKREVALNIFHELGHHVIEVGMCGFGCLRVDSQKRRSSAHSLQIAYDKVWNFVGI